MDQSRKLPIYASLVETARKTSTRAVHMDGRSMPATVVSVSGSIVTVNFELESGFTLPQIAVPVFGAEYIRQPIQKGCKGVVIASDYYLGAMSGLGPGRATLPKRGNLSNLVFFPIGNSGWSSVDSDTLTMYGVSGVKILDKLGGSSYVEVEEGAITLSNGNSTVKMNGGNVEITGTLIINGQQYTSHTHTNGNEGNPTGGVIP